MLFIRKCHNICIYWDIFAIRKDPAVQSHQRVELPEWGSHRGCYSRANLHTLPALMSSVLMALQPVLCVKQEENVPVRCAVIYLAMTEGKGHSD